MQPNEDKLWIHHSHGVSGLLQGEVHEAVQHFLQAMKQLCDRYHARSNAVQGWEFRLKFLSFNIFVITSQVYSFTAAVQRFTVEELSEVEQSCIGMTLMYNLALCHHLQFASVHRSENLLRAQRLFISAMQTCQLVLQTSLMGDAPNNANAIVPLMVSIGNNLGCLGSEVYDYTLVATSMQWLETTGVELPHAVVLNHWIWQQQRSSPSAAA